MRRSRVAGYDRLTTFQHRCCQRQSKLAAEIETLPANAFVEAAAQLLLLFAANQDRQMGLPCQDMLQQIMPAIFQPCAMWSNFSHTRDDTNKTSAFDRLVLEKRLQSLLDQHIRKNCGKQWIRQLIAYRF